MEKMENLLQELREHLLAEAKAFEAGADGLGPVTYGQIAYNVLHLCSTLAEARALHDALCEMHKELAVLHPKHFSIVFVVDLFMRAANEWRQQQPDPVMKAPYFMFFDARVEHALHDDTEKTGERLTVLAGKRGGDVRTGFAYKVCTHGTWFQMNKDGSPTFNNDAHISVEKFGGQVIYTHKHAPVTTTP